MAIFLKKNIFMSSFLQFNIILHDTKAHQFMCLMVMITNFKLKKYDKNMFFLRKITTILI